VPLRKFHGRWIPPDTADALPLRSSLSPQVGGAIAGDQILPVSENLAAAHHRQVAVLAIAEHLGHGAAVLVDRLGAERHHRTLRATAGGRRPLFHAAGNLRELLAGLEGFRAFWAAPALMAVSPDPLLQSSQIPVRPWCPAMPDAGFEPATSCL
jgi:hypothetical protein